MLSGENAVGNCRNDLFEMGQHLRPWGLESRCIGAFWDAIKHSCLGYHIYTHTKIREVENLIEVLDVNCFRNPEEGNIKALD
jgi:hypothetical protein